MKCLLCIALVLLCAFSASASAHAAEYPAAVQEILDDAPLDVSDLLSFSWDELKEIVVSRLTAPWQEMQKSGMQLLGYLAVSTVCLACLQGAACRDCAESIVLIGFAKLCFSQTSALMQAADQALQNCTIYLNGFFPVLAGVTAASGASSAALVCGGFAAVTALLSALLRVLFFPLLRVYMVLCLGLCFWDSGGMARLCGLFEQLLRLLLKALGAALGAFVGLQSLLAGNADTVGIRMGSALLSGLLPVAGSVAAQALSTTLAGLQLVRGLLAVAACCSVGALLLPVLVYTAFCGVLYTLAGILADVANLPGCGALAANLAVAARLSSAFLLLFGYMTLLTTILFLLLTRGGMG